MAGIVNGITQIIVSISALGTVCIAWLGYNRWKKELISKKKYDAALKIWTFVSKNKKSMDLARSIVQLHFLSEEFAKKGNPFDSRIYDLTQKLKFMKTTSRELIENYEAAKIIINCPLLPDKIQQMSDHGHKIFSAIGMEIDDLRDPDNAVKDKKIKGEIKSILNKDDTPGSKAFTDKVELTYKEIERLLRDYLFEK